MFLYAKIYGYNLIFIFILRTKALKRQGTKQKTGK